MVRIGSFRYFFIIACSEIQPVLSYGRSEGLLKLITAWAVLQKYTVYTFYFLYNFFAGQFKFFFFKYISLYIFQNMLQLCP
jgi:hypothetical protein